MAALILGAGALAYDHVQKSRARRKARRDHHNDVRFTELERENAARLRLPQHQQEEEAGGTCSCDEQRMDGRGRCPEHGDAVAGGEVGGGGGMGEGGGGGGGRRRREEAPAYVDVTGGGDGRGSGAEEEGVRGLEGEEGHAEQRRGGPETEVERLRINEERRKIMRKDKGYRKLFGRKKGGQEAAIA